MEYYKDSNYLLYYYSRIIETWTVPPATVAIPVPVPTSAAVSTATTTATSTLKRQNQA
jgi:hypothetical protein